MIRPMSCADSNCVSRALLTRVALAFIVVCTLAGCSGLGTSADSSHSELDYSDELDITRRSEWGWTASKTSLPEHSISKITIHHGGVSFSDDRDPIEYLRSLQKWSREERGWMDIPYHFVIDLKGKVYEARPLQFPGDTNTTYETRTHALIVVVGNYEVRELTELQFESLVRLTAFLAAEYSVELPDIRGHIDYAPGETACPGSNIYQYFEDGSLLRRVERINEDNP
jgi:uncharacterized protein YceK